MSSIQAGLPGGLGRCLWCRKEMGPAASPPLGKAWGCRAGVAAPLPQGGCLQALKPVPAPFQDPFQRATLVDVISP